VAVDKATRELADRLRAIAELRDPEELTAAARAAIREHEKRAAVARMEAGKRAKRRRGGLAEGAPRYGYRLEGGAIVPDVAEQRGVALIRRLRRKGASWREICSELEAAGIRPRKAARWYPTTAKRVFEYGNRPHGRRRAS
jgi:DNA invertase Pin-like site-specific DNA recombinase